MHDVPCAAYRHQLSVRHRGKGRWLVTVECLNGWYEPVHPPTRGVLVKAGDA